MPNPAPRSTSCARAHRRALTKSVKATQGLITEAGYQEKAQSYRTMASAAGIAADAENEAAKGDEIADVMKGVGMQSSRLPGRFAGALVRHSMRQIYADGAAAQVREAANSLIGEF